MLKSLFSRLRSQRQIRSVRTNRKSSRRFEALETRWAMTGNLTAELVGGTLLITGDELDNGVIIRGTGVAGEVEVIGVADYNNAQPTTLNGASNPIIFTGVTESIVVNLLAGSDNVDVSSLVIKDDLIINTHAGWDEVYVFDVVVYDNLEINTHEDSDYVYLGKYVPIGEVPDEDNEDEVIEEDFTREISVAPPLIAGCMVLVDGSLIVNTGSSNDTFEAGLTFVDDDFIVALESGNDIGNIYNATAGTLFSFTSGSGDDQINVYYLSSFGNFVADTGSGNDLWSYAASANYQNTTILTGDGIDYIAQVVQNLHGNVTIDSGAGNDTVYGYNVLGKQNMLIVTGQGTDLVDWLGSTAKKLTVDTGSESDLFCLTYCALNELLSLSGSGDDQVYLSGNLITGLAFLDGGSNKDKLDRLGNTIGSQTVVGFEQLTYDGKPVTT